MSMYGEGIIERLPEGCSLKVPGNPGAKVIDSTIGEWLDNIDVNVIKENLFLQEASGAYLDLQGKVFGVPRKLEESDEDYRSRIVYESLGHLTANYLMDVYGLPLYAYVSSFSVSENDLTSDNPYIHTGNVMSIADNETKNILGNKFVIGGDLIWLTL